MSESLKKFRNIFIWITIFLFCIRCYISGKSSIQSFSFYDIYGFSAEAIAVSSIIMFFYEKKLWKFNPFSGVPVLHKKYKGQFISSYDNVEREASLEIKQTLLTIKIIFITRESKSTSTCTSIDEICGEKVLTYCYLNTPSASVRNRSEIHNGTAIICVDNPEELTGQYYTDRKTIGDMKFYPEDN